jgi:hypothetical protein
MENNYLYSCSSYIAAPAGAARIVEVLKRAWREGPAMAVDQVLQNAVRAKELRIGCSMPFVTWFDLKIADVSTAERSYEIPIQWSLRRLLRYLFFVDCDMQNYLVPAITELIRNNSDRDLTRDERHTIDFAKKVLAACGAAKNQG